MAAKSTENASVTAETTVDEEVKVPHQNHQPTLEVIEGEKVSFSERTKGVLSNKKFVAGVASVVAIAVGVLVVNKKRGEDVPESEVAEG